MIRHELLNVRRPFFDCTGVRAGFRQSFIPADDLHMHAAITRPLPRPAARYIDIKVALRLTA